MNTGAATKTRTDPFTRLLTTPAEDRDDDQLIHLFRNDASKPHRGEYGIALCGRRARRRLGGSPNGRFRPDHCRACIHALKAGHN